MLTGNFSIAKQEVKNPQTTIKQNKTKTASIPFIHSCKTLNIFELEDRNYIIDILKFRY